MPERSSDGERGRASGGGRGRRTRLVLLFGLVATATLTAIATWVITTRPSRVATPSVEDAAREAPPPTFATKVARGEWLFRTKGCGACHGEEGKGGVQNQNYIADEVPALNAMAERLMLFEPEDATKAVALLEKGVALASVTTEPFPDYARFVAQYASVRQVIQKGNPAGKEDQLGPTPPLQMPAWGDQLDEDDIRAIVAYLITLYPWDEA